jgi:hypothetical protein
LQIIYAEKNQVQGGSYILIIQKKVSKNIFEEPLKRILDSENAFFNSFDIKIFKKVLTNKRQFWAQISNRFIENKQKLIGVGASLRGISLINYYDINHLIFECIFEVNIEKIGCWTPGKSIKIIEENVESNKWDYFLFLAWTQKDILEKKKFLDIEGVPKTIIIPNSTFEIIGPDPLKLRDIAGVM